MKKKTLTVHDLDVAITSPDRTLLSFKNRTIIGKLNLKLLKRDIHFTHCEFEEEFILEGDSETKLSISNEIKFENCLFKEKVQVKNVEFNKKVEFGPVSNEGTISDRDDTKFTKEFSLENTEFNEKASFQKCHFFGKTNFYNTSFKEYVSFWNCTFAENVIFLNTKFHKTAILSDIIFQGNALLTYTLIENVLTLRGSKFKKGLDLSLAYIQGKITANDIEFEKWKGFKTLEEELKNKEDNALAKKFHSLLYPDEKNGDSKISVIKDFYKNENADVYQCAVRREGHIPFRNKIETFKILGKLYKENNDIVQGLEVRKFEKKTLKEFYKSKGAFKFLVNRFILGLNGLSNIYGTSFLRGIVFTFLGSSIIFYIMLTLTEEYVILCTNCDFDWQVFEEVVKYYFISLDPTHKSDFIETSLAPSGFFQIFNFAQRIFVSYGLFQIVQAFRKFR
ncbi:Pentapeptide repeat-containing protein [Pricia antarctica]|uniref:Pentapeptide repeat-containing protein n=1 Tax=Pricia antarctica TaxID=641691 RepID=A0A1G7IFE0_9FLAO|nr:pentapeptide repeat-containing protein [Pricia antarctica]SDF11308.1 Pentapeptide repeat-containing protein [Pricia antarctica]